MLPSVIRLAATAETALVVAEGTGVCNRLLPLAGSHISQLGIVLGAAVVMHEVGSMVLHAARQARKDRARAVVTAATHDDR